MIIPNTNRTMYLAEYMASHIRGMGYKMIKEENLNSCVEIMDHTRFHGIKMSEILNPHCMTDIQFQFLLPIPSSNSFFQFLLPIPSSNSFFQFLLPIPSIRGKSEWVPQGGIHLMPYYQR